MSKFSVDNFFSSMGELVNVSEYAVECPLITTLLAS